MKFCTIFVPTLAKVGYKDGTKLMALMVYTRHSAHCKKRADRLCRRCRCPKWLQGILNGRTVRESAGTRSWDRAEEKRRDLENAADELNRAIRNGMPVPAERGVTIDTAIGRFIESKRKVGLSKNTLGKLTLIFEKRLKKWAANAGVTFIAQITTAHLDAFRNTLPIGAMNLQKTQQRIVGFFHYCRRMGWISANPAEHLSRIIIKQKPTDYFTRAEFEALMDASYLYKPKGWLDCRHQSERLRVLMLLMRWSGLAIRDAVCLERARLSDNDELFLYRAKTGVPVHVPLPYDVAEALRTIPPGPKPNPAYFFWSGNGDPKSAVADWQRSFRRLFKIANLKNDDGTDKRCFPHMFRDTFAVELLLAGAKLEEVSLLLGHSSIKTTEKHYAPFVKARRELLAATVRQAWAAQGKVVTIASAKRRAANA